MSAEPRQQGELLPAGPLPARIGARYDVVDRLGRGGMAVVYRVRDRSHPGELALKQLLVSGAAQEPHIRASFEREFQVLAQLAHPSAVEVHDFGVDTAGPYYTMELLDYGDLNEGTPWPLDRACRLTMQLCSLLSLLHARGYVHRDITPRNVRLSPDGAAKLIDFGAMVPFGPCTQAVGTPGFVAPEVVHHLKLDARTDLFSLGATLYFSLTGQRPFPARTLAELDDLWLRKLVAPSELVPGIPAALDALVAALLQIDPLQRPKSAVEVLQRLAAISGESLADSAEYAHAYLTAPELVGREREQRRFRKSLARAHQREGGALLFEGAPGSGRTRLLEACVLAAQTSGAVVLRVDARATQPFAFASAGKLARQLLEALPDDAPSDADSARIFAAERGDEAGPARPSPNWASDAHAFQDAWLLWFSRTCQQHTLVIAVDDLDRIDAASLGLLVALTRSGNGSRSLLLAGLETPSGATTAPALTVLRRESELIRLEALRPEETDALLVSMFADAPHVLLVSARVHALTAGNPRAVMALAHYLVERRLIRYVDGSWILPAALELSDLPASVEDALRQQLDALPVLARRLAQAQALALEAPWTRHDYREFAGGETAHADAALELLLRQGFLIEKAGHYALAYHGVRTCLRAQLTAAEQLELERALATWCTHTGRHGFIEAYHLLRGAREQAGLERIHAVLEHIPNISEAHRQLGIEPRVIAATLESAYQHSLALARPPRETCELARRLMALGVIAGDELYYRYAPIVLRQLEEDSGLAEYRRLPEALSAADRLRTALGNAAAKYQRAAPAERVYQVSDAIRHLTHYVSVSNVVAMNYYDMPLLLSTPSVLEPFAGVSPVLHALWQTTLFAVETCYSAQLEQAHSRAVELYNRLASITVGEIPFADQTRQIMVQGTASVGVLLGYPSAENWIRLIESHPEQRHVALRLRRTLCMFQGDHEAGEQLRKQSETLAAQAVGSDRLLTALLSELLLQVRTADLGGVKQVLERVAELAAEKPGWRCMHDVALGFFHRMRGDLSAASAAFERALEAARPDRPEPKVARSLWLLAVEGCMGVLSERGELEEAQRLGAAALAQSEALEVTGFPRVTHELALVEAKLGHHQRAAARLDALIAHHAGRSAWYLAFDYEARARVAFLAEDREAAVRFAELALQSSAAGGANASARARLVEGARRIALDLALPPSGLESALKPRTPRPLDHALQREVKTELAPSHAPDARAARALKLLCRALHAKAELASLFFIDEAGLVHAATLGSVDGDLERSVRRYWQQRQVHLSMTTVFTAPEQPSGGLRVGWWIGRGGVQYCLLPLSPRGESESLGLLACALPTREVRAEVWPLAAAICLRLRELGDLGAD